MEFILENMLKDNIKYLYNMSNNVTSTSSNANNFSFFSNKRTNTINLR